MVSTKTVVKRETAETSDSSSITNTNHFCRASTLANHQGYWINGNGGGEVSYKLLFRKELTPSDVGRLHRLVVPKKYALKYLPSFSHNNMNLVFYDKNMSRWRFRYCYWKSSPSFAFTKGWGEFVKEHQLKCGDTVIFLGCHSNQLGFFSKIEVAKDDELDHQNYGHLDTSTNGSMDFESKDHVHVASRAISEYECERKLQIEDQEEVKPQMKPFRLFGVEIITMDPEVLVLED